MCMVNSYDLPPGDVEQTQRCKGSIDALQLFVQNLHQPWTQQYTAQRKFADVCESPKYKKYPKFFVSR